MLRAGILAASCCIGFAVFVPSRAALPVCLDGYALYSSDATDLGTRDSVASGKSGSNGSVTLGNDATNRGSLTARQNIVLENKAKIFGDVTAGGTVTLKQNAQITGTILQHAAVPTCALPQESFSIGTQDVNVSGAASLAPGDYHDINVTGTGILKLEAGTYRVKSLTVLAQGQVELDAASGNIEVFVSQAMDLGDKAQIGFAGAAKPEAVKFHTQQSCLLGLGPDAMFHGTLVAPLAEVQALPRTRITGAVYAKKIKFAPDVKVGYTAYAPGTGITVVNITSPANGFLTNQSLIPVAWTVNGVAQATQTTEALANEGNNTLKRCSGMVCDSITVIRDQTPPVVVITSPAEGSFSNQFTIPIVWTVDGTRQTADTLEILTQEGANSIGRSATDAAGNTGTASIQVTRDTQAPVVVITSPANGFETEQASVHVSWTVDGVNQVADTSAVLVQGSNTVSRSAADAAGNTGNAAVTVLRTVTSNGPEAFAQVEPSNGGTPLTVTFTGSGKAKSGFIQYHKLDFDGDGRVDTTLIVPIDTLTQKEFGFENGLEGWVSDSNNGNLTLARGGPRSEPSFQNQIWTTNQTGSYPNNVGEFIYSPPISIPVAVACSLSFHQYFSSEENADFGFVQVFDIGFNSYTERVFTGNLGPSDQAIDLSDFAGQTVKIALIFVSDEQRVSTGWKIYNLQLATYENGVKNIVFADDADNAATWETFSNSGSWSHITPAPILGMGAQWIEAGASSYTYTDNADSWITSPKIFLSPNVQSILSFWQHLSTWDYGDGGIVEISANGGAFSLLIPTGGYPGVLTGHGNGYTGLLGASTPLFDLSPFAGDSVQIRFHFFSDASGSLECGWLIDNVRILEKQGLDGGISRVVHTYTTPSVYPAVFSVVDDSGREGKADLRTTAVTVGPAGTAVVSIISPKNGAFTNQTTIPVVWAIGGVVQTSQANEELTQEGENFITRTISDGSGYSASATVRVIRDTQMPIVAIASPANGLLTNLTEIPVVWTVDGMLQHSDTLENLGQEGVNTITRTFTDEAGNSGSASIQVIRDTQAPVVEIISPAPASIIHVGTVPPTQVNIPVQWTVDGVPQTTGVTETAFFDFDATYAAFSRSATDAAGNIGNASTYVFFEFAPFHVQIISPADGTISRVSTILVAYTIYGFPHSRTYMLQPGDNEVIISDTDNVGNVGSDTIHVVFESNPPTWPSGASLTATDIHASSLVLHWPEAQDDSGVGKYLVYRDGALVAEVPGTRHKAAVSGLLMGTEYDFKVEASDPGGSVSLDGPRNAFETGTELPPDPATVAPAVPAGVATTIAAAAAFLYQGPDALQTGVADSAIDPTHLVILRGNVQNTDGEPAAGITVSMLGHSEFGSTVTRADGGFDLVMNGGGYSIVSFVSKGYLTAQRTLRPRWQEFQVLDTVVLTKVETATTEISLAPNQPLQVARASVVADDRGERQATLFFPINTRATMAMPDGRLQTLNAMHVRATEFTVGPNGPKAMPGDLPPNSAYTYALEFTVDEAVAAGAGDVRFEKPIWNYLENFLNIPVGNDVPAAFYDRQKGVWVPTDDGRVIRIESITGGKANLVVGKGGATATLQMLEDLGFTDEERTKLANLYAPGQSLWRVPVSHFTSYDYNYPPGLPPDSEDPDGDRPEGDDDDRKSDCKSGSIIDCQNQSLGEDVNVPGFPGLHYRSIRVPAKRWNTIRIHLSGESIPASVAVIRLQVSIAGRKFSYQFMPRPNLTFPFTWDGKDAYGRTLLGKQPYSYNIDYGYPMAYQEPPESDPPRCGKSGNLDFGPCRDFGLNGSSSSNIISPQLYYRSNGYSGHMGIAEIGDLGTGWSLDLHHGYDPAAGTLHEGSGKDRGVETLLGAIYTIAGKPDQSGYGGDGGPALDALLETVNEMDIGPDGALYMAERGSRRIRKIDKNSVISTVAEGREWYSVKAAADGTLYLCDGNNGGNRVWKVSPEGELSVFAGNGSGGYNGDDKPATEAKLSYPHIADIGPDGSVYIADQANSRLRKVSPDGIIHTVAGTGLNPYNGDGIPATQANMSVASVAAAPDGNVYICDAFNGRIRKVDPSGIVSTVAGNGTSGTSGDGGPATEAAVVTSRIRVVNTKAGGTRIYLFDELNRMIRFVDENGIIHRLAGGGFDRTKDGIPAVFADLSEPRGMAVDPNGNIYLGLFNSGNGLVRKIIGEFPAFTNLEFSIPSADGSEIYRFSPEGRHLKTFNAYTGKELLNFGYNAQGHLTRITDAYGNVTEIQRDADGNPLTIRNPYGQILTLQSDADRNLTRIALPNSESHDFTYSDGNLMATYTTPRHQVHNFTYDNLGRLTRDDNPAGGFTTVVKQDLTDHGWVSKLTSAMGRQSLFESIFTEDLSKVKNNTDPSGFKTTTETASMGVITTVSPDSTRTRTVLGPDPQLAFQGMIPTVSLTELPSGLSLVESKNQGAVLAERFNYLSLASFADTTVVNNARTYLTSYDNSARQWVRASPENRTDTTRIDSLGKVVEKAVPGLENVAYGYDPRGRLSSITQGAGADLRSTQFSYNGSGFLSSITDAENRVFGFEYDLAGRVTKEVLPDLREVAYAYDADGNVTSITPPGKPAHAFAYTPVDLEETYSPPTLGSSNWETQNGYNLDKQLLDVDRPDGRNIHYIYDAGGRATSIATPSGDFGFGYSPTTGKLQTLSSPYGVNLAYAYDGFLPTTVSWSGDVGGSVQVGYDANFWVTSQSVNGANTVSFVHDNDGLLTGAGDLAMTRDPQNGRLTGSSVGVVSDALSYNDFGEISGYEATVSGSPVYQCAYERDKLGRITKKTETVEGLTHVFEYGYDLAGRLRQVKKEGVVAALYAYDDNGNRLSKTEASGATSGTFDDQDRLVQYGSTTYSYNNHGDLESKTEGGQTTSYNYDVFGNLLRVVLPSGDLIEYVIDGQNRRVGKKVNGVLVQGLLYQNQLNPVAELDGLGNVVARFVYGSKSNVPDFVIKAGVTYRIVSDHLGSPRLVVNTVDGTIVERMVFDEFGNVLEDSNPGLQPFGFAGGLYDRDTRLVRFGARDYAAQESRWNTKDSVKFSKKEMNRFVYVENDPINNIDPNGKWLIPAAIAIGVGLPVAVTYAYLSCVKKCDERAQQTRSCETDPTGSRALGTCADQCNPFLSLPTGSGLGDLGQWVIENIVKGIFGE